VSRGVAETTEPALAFFANASDFPSVNRCSDKLICVHLEVEVPFNHALTSTSTLLKPMVLVARTRTRGVVQLVINGKWSFPPFVESLNGQCASSLQQGPSDLLCPVA
jgi:hypothetical protein